jgi:hypothetical protein
MGEDSRDTKKHWAAGNDSQREKTGFETVRKGEMVMMKPMMLTGSSDPRVRRENINSSAFTD